MPEDPARATAYSVLRAVDERDAYANLALPQALREGRLDPRDAALATELTYGVLRGRGQLDAVLAACVDRPLDALDPPVLDVLRLGAYQLLHTRIPPHAAVSSSVSLARRRVGEGASRFVNAVLRRVAARDLDGWMATVAPAPEADWLGHLVVVTSHPRWIVSAYADLLGTGEDLRAALEANNIRPFVHLVARPGRISRDDLLAEAGEGAEPGGLSPYAVHLPSGGDPGRLASVRRGDAAVQDEGSQLVGVAAAEAPLEGTDRNWLDLAAGPGGKAALLAAIGSPRDALVLAGEVVPHRARLVARALEGSPGRALTVVTDSRHPAWSDGTFDRVLLDAPCTGLGALRRRPEARWRRSPADLATLGRLQRDLVTSAVAALRPGGVLTYATCSPHLAETRAVVLDALRKHSLEELDARAVLPGVADVGSGPSVQLWPHRHGTDAMFVALLRKRGG